MQIPGFRQDRQYQDSTGQDLAVRWMSEVTCVPITILEKDVVPQIFLTVDTAPENDLGLAHALEHLLVGKGTKGRYWSLLSQMHLSHTTAATDHAYTYYGFDAPAGPDSFFELLHALLDALMRPDFTDDEAAHEFYHFDVTKDSQNQRLSLTEAGTVYSEMQTGFGQWDFWYELNKALLGPTHPWSFVAGGNPTEMRKVTPPMIRTFHADHYKVGPGINIYVALNPKIATASFLQKLDLELRRFLPDNAHAEKLATPVCPMRALPIAIRRSEILSEPKPITKFVPYPNSTATDPVALYASWNPVKTSNLQDIHELSFLLHLLAGDTESPLYKNLVDPKTKKISIVATSVSGSVLTDHSPEWPIANIILSGFPSEQLTEKNVKKIRQVIFDTMKTVAELPAGSAALKKYNDKVLNLITATLRSESTWLKYPPKLGVLQGFYYWKERFDLLELEPGGVVMLDQSDLLKTIAAKIKTSENIWKDVIERSGLLQDPHVSAGKPSPQLLEQNMREAEERKNEKLRNLRAADGSADEKDVLQKLLGEEKKFAEFCKNIEDKMVRPPFVKKPPLTFDPDIKYQTGRLAFNTKYVLSLFDETPLESVSFRFNSADVPANLLPYMPALSWLIDRVGLVEDRVETTSAELGNQMLRDGANVNFQPEADWRQGQFAWVAKVTGRNLEELKTSVRYLRRIWSSANFETSNLEKIRARVFSGIKYNDQLTSRIDGAWAQTLNMVFRSQGDPRASVVYSGLAHVHWLERLGWRLHAPITADHLGELKSFVASLEQRLDGSTTLPQLLATKISSDINREFAEYVLKNLTRMPPGRDAENLRQLFSETLADLAVGPQKTLEDFKALRTFLMNRRGLAVEIVAALPDWQLMRPWLNETILGFPARKVIPFRPEKRSEKRILNKEGLKNLIHYPVSDLPLVQNIQRREHDFEFRFPFFLGFEDNSESVANLSITFEGSKFDSAKTDNDAAIKEILAREVLAGAGPHTYFMKAWQSGLAYSNGVSSNPFTGEIAYSAQRSTNLSSLMALLGEHTRAAVGLNDPSLVDYALSNSFSSARAVMGPIERGDALATDLRQTFTPEKVKKFSLAMLNERYKKNLMQELAPKIPELLKPLDVIHHDGAELRHYEPIYLFEGPTEQLKSVNRVLKPPDRLFLVYASDFWLPF